MGKDIETGNVVNLGDFPRIAPPRPEGVTFTTSGEWREQQQAEAHTPKKPPTVYAVGSLEDPQMRKDRRALLMGM